MQYIKAIIKRLEVYIVPGIRGRQKKRGSRALTGLSVIAEQGIASTANFLTGVIIGRYCTKEQFGLYMLGLSLIFIILNLQTSIISMPYMVGRHELSGNEHNLYSGSTLIHQLIFAGLATASMIIGQVIIAFGLGPQKLQPVIWALAFTVSFIMLREYTRRFLLANFRIKLSFIMTSLIAGIQVGGILILAYLELLTASRTYLVIGIACGLITIYWLIRIRNEFTFLFEKSISDFIKNWSIGKWIVVSNLSLLLSHQLYPWFLTAYYGEAYTGHYAACWGIVALANPLLLGVGNYLGPELAYTFRQEGINGLRRMVFGSTILISIFAIFIFFWIIVFDDQIILWTYGDKYSGTGLVLSIMALSYIAMSVGPSNSLGLLAMGQSIANFIVNLVALIVTMFIGLWFVKTYGVLGAAIGLLTSSTAASVIRITVFVKISLRKNAFIR